MNSPSPERSPHRAPAQASASDALPYLITLDVQEPPQALEPWEEAPTQKRTLPAAESLPPGPIPPAPAIRRLRCGIPRRLLGLARPLLTWFMRLILGGKGPAYVQRHVSKQALRSVHRQEGT